MLLVLVKHLAVLLIIIIININNSGNNCCDDKKYLARCKLYCSWHALLIVSHYMRISFLKPSGMCLCMTRVWTFKADWIDVG